MPVLILDLHRRRARPRRRCRAHRRRSAAPPARWPRSTRAAPRSASTPCRRWRRRRCVELTRGPDTAALGGGGGRAVLRLARQARSSGSATRRGWCSGRIVCGGHQRVRVRPRRGRRTRRRTSTPGWSTASTTRAGRWPGRTGSASTRCSATIEALYAERREERYRPAPLLQRSCSSGRHRRGQRRGLPHPRRVSRRRPPPAGARARSLAAARLTGLPPPDGRRDDLHARHAVRARRAAAADLRALALPRARRAARRLRARPDDGGGAVRRRARRPDRPPAAADRRPGRDRRRRRRARGGDAGRSSDGARRPRPRWPARRAARRSTRSPARR